MKYKTFKDLEFVDKIFGGSFATLYFDNGYGASVIQGEGAYCTKGTYELAVLKDCDGGHELTYDTPITSNVEGHQSPDDITKLLRRIQDL